jgi:Type II restriction endonuclease, TdeIII
MMESKTINQVKKILTKCIDGAIRRASKNKSFRPFHEALLSTEVVNLSSFERSFSTSFGQGPIEEISFLIARDNGYNVVRQKQTLVNVYKGAVDEIERILSGLRTGERKPDWEKEVQKITAFKKGDTEVRRVITDLWLEKDDIQTYMSIKTVKPNLDQTEIAKKDLLLLKAHDINYKTYFALFYNPGGSQRKDYNWSIPSKIFDMQKDTCVLIGEDYRDYLGGSGSYSSLLKLFKEVGHKTQERIRNL